MVLHKHNPSLVIPLNVDSLDMHKMCFIVCLRLCFIIQALFTVNWRTDTDPVWWMHEQTDKCTDCLTSTPPDFKRTRMKRVKVLFESESMRLNENWSFSGIVLYIIHVKYIRNNDESGICCPCKYSLLFTARL